METTVWRRIRRYTCVNWEGQIIQSLSSDYAGGGFSAENFETAHEFGPLHKRHESNLIWRNDIFT